MIALLVYGLVWLCAMGLFARRQMGCIRKFRQWVMAFFAPESPMSSVHSFRVNSGGSSGNGSGNGAGPSDGSNGGHGRDGENEEEFDFDGAKQSVNRLDQWFLGTHLLIIVLTTSSVVLLAKSQLHRVVLGLFVGFGCADVVAMVLRRRDDLTTLAYWVMCGSFLGWPTAWFMLTAVAKDESMAVAGLYESFCIIELMLWTCLTMAVQTIQGHPTQAKGVMWAGMLALMACSLARMLSNWNVNGLHAAITCEGVPIVLVLLPLNLGWFLLMPIVQKYASAGAALRKSREEVDHLHDQLATLRLESEVFRKKTGNVSMLAHEVRTPLNAMLSACTLLQDTGSLTAEQVELVRLMTTCGSQISNNINFVLHMSRMESGKIELESKPFSIHRLCHDIIDTVRSLAENKRIDVRFNCVQSIAPLRGDAARLSQALQNLLTNSIKFTHKGSVTLNTIVAPIEGGLTDGLSRMAHVTFEIVDTGIGMTVEEQQKLFQPYVQANAATQRQFGGTGLGLVITKQIVQLMGGTVRIDATRTAVGVGTTMIVELKLPMMYTPSSCNLIDGIGSQIRSVAPLTPIAQNRLRRRSMMSCGLPGTSSRIAAQFLPGSVENASGSIPSVAQRQALELPNVNTGLYPSPSYIPTPRAPARGASQSFEAIYAAPPVASLVVSPSAIPPIPPPPPPISISSTSLSKWKHLKMMEAAPECDQPAPSTSEPSASATCVDAATATTTTTSAGSLPFPTGALPDPQTAEVPEMPPSITVGDAERPQGGDGCGQIICGGRVVPLETLFRLLRVLLIEDNMLSGTLMTRILKSMGFDSVEHVLGAEAALEHLAAHRNVHIIITDLHLAGSINGRQFAALVRSQLNYRSHSMFLDANATTADGNFDREDTIAANDLLGENGSGETFGMSEIADSASSTNNLTPTSASAFLRPVRRLTRTAALAQHRSDGPSTTATNNNKELPLILGLSGDADEGTPAACLEDPHSLLPPPSKSEVGMVVCFQAGMNGFLSKPITRDRLSATLVSLLVDHSSSHTTRLPIALGNDLNQTDDGHCSLHNDQMIITLNA